MASIYTATLRMAATTYYLIETIFPDSTKTARNGLIWTKQFGGYGEEEGEKPNERSCIFQERQTWLSEGQAQEAILDPTQFMDESQKQTFKTRHKDWELFVTEYKPDQAKRYDHEDAGGERKALRKAAILSRMSPEDRALFQ